MKVLDLHTVEEKLNTIADFLYPCLSLANGHATDFITKNYWDSYIPTCMQDELLSLTREQLTSLPCNLVTHTLVQSSVRSSVSSNGLELDSEIDTKGENEKRDHISNLTKCNSANNHHESQNQCVCSHKDGRGIKSNIVTQVDGLEYLKGKLQYSSIAEYCSAAKACTIEGLGLAVNPEILENLDVAQNDLFIGTFMSEKKCHEVEIMSKVCSSIARSAKCKLVIDFGSGKGYLGKHMSLQYKIPVLGVDAVDTNTQSAGQRSAVLDKQWLGLTRNAEHKLDGKKLSKKEKKKSRVRGKMKSKEDNESKSGTVVCSKDIEASDELDEGESSSNSSKALNHDIVKDGGMKISSENFEQKPNTGMLVDFVPCTCYIDENTNFMQLADRNFPYLFSSNLTHKNISSESHSFSEHLTFDSDVNRCEVQGKNESNVSEFDDTSVCTHDSFKSCSSNSKNSCGLETSQTVVDEEISCLCRRISLKERTHCDEQSLCMKCSSNVDHNADLGRLKIMLVGLHTCGNLASTSLELFAKNDELSVLCNVGCCYHLIEEKFREDKAVEVKGEKASGFPLSTCLNKMKFSLGNTARNLASQAVYRVPEFEQLQGERFYPRALLEVLLQDIEGKTMGPPKGLRGLERKSKSIKDYLKRACDKLKISDRISDEMLDDYMKKYEHEKHRLAAFFQLKTVLAPCIESLIILDRAAFLLEQGNISKVYLMKMFDPVISPRCYAIVALKK